MSKHIETVVVGGGQAGLAVSYYLSEQNRSHIVLEQAHKSGNVWRNHRWDSFTLNTPNWQSVLPGGGVPGTLPDGFLSGEEIVAYFENYVRQFQLPVRYGIRVESVRQRPSGLGYVIETSIGSFEAVNVVIATGLYQKPKTPSFSKNFPTRIKQIHSDEYRNSNSLPDGSILVVGSGQSGAQIAEELYQSGKKVYLLETPESNSQTPLSGHAQIPGQNSLALPTRPNRRTGSCSSFLVNPSILQSLC